MSIMTEARQRRHTKPGAARRGDLVSVIAEQQALVDDWTNRRTLALGELLALEEKAGEAALDNPEAAGQIVRRKAEMRDLIGIADQAIPAAQGRLLEAQRTALRAEVDWWNAETAKRQAVRINHEARTAQLVALLLEHEGRYVSVQEADAHAGSMMMQPGQRSILDGAPALKSELLRFAVEDARLKAAICQAVANGDDPRAVTPDGRLSSEAWGQNRPLEAHEYPSAVWGPAAILPAPRYVDAVESARGQLMRHDQHMADLPGQIAEVEAWAAEKGRPTWDELTDGERQRIALMRQKLEAGTTERARLEQQLVELAG